jgi:hypothetical protein
MQLFRKCLPDFPHYGWMDLSPSILLPGWSGLAHNKENLSMTMKIWRWQRVALLAAGILVTTVSAAWGGTTPLYELHWDGTVWQYTGVPCSEGYCPGWQELDNNGATAEIAAGGGQLYELHNSVAAGYDNSIWMYTGQPCTPSGCRGWVQIGETWWEPPMHAATQIINAANGVLVQEQLDGSLWQFTGRACSGSQSCPGWTEIDDNSDYLNYVVGAAGLLEQHYSDDSIWTYTGPPCTGNYCPGWKQISGNPNTINSQCQYPVLNCSMTSGVSSVYQLWSDGAIWKYTGTPCDPACNGWQQMDNNPNTKQISAGGGLYQIHNDGSIWQSSGTPCNGGYCGGWWLIDNNPASIWVFAGPNTVYQMRSDASIWQYVGPICNGAVCSGWVQLDNNPATTLLVPGF